MDLFITTKEDTKDTKEMFLKKFEDGSLQFSELKKYVAELIFGALSPIQTKRAQLAKNTEYVDKVIKDGAEKARKVASETLKEVKKTMGIDF